MWSLFEEGDNLDDLGEGSSKSMTRVEALGETPCDNPVMMFLMLQIYRQSHIPSQYSPMLLCFIRLHSQLDDVKGPVIREASTELPKTNSDVVVKPTASPSRNLIF